MLLLLLACREEGLLTPPPANVVTVTSADTDSGDPGGTDSGPTGTTDSGSTDSGSTDSGSTDSNDSGADDSGSTDPVVYPEPCAAWGAAVAMGNVADPELNEISAVVPSQLNPGVLWVLEDHGGEAEIYAILADGTGLGALSLDGLENLDWESMALSACDEGWCLWIGDTGNNDRDREQRGVHRIVEPNLFDGTVILPATTTATSYYFHYPSTPEDVEAMVVEPSGRPVIITKEPEGVSNLYAVSTTTPDADELVTLLGQLVVDTGEDTGRKLVTDASLWPDGSRLLLRTYASVLELVLGEGGLDNISTAVMTEVVGAEEPRGEGIGYDPLGSAFYQVPEGVNPTIWKVLCGG